MKKFLTIVALLMPLTTFAILPSGGAYELDRQGPAARKYSLGSNLKEANTFGVKGTWSFEHDGGAVSTINLKNEWLSEAIVLPAGAIIYNCFFDVATGMTSAGGTGKISINANAANDLKTSTDADTFSGDVACVPDGTVGNSIKLTAERNLTVTIASEALTAGKINVFVQYVLSE